MKLETFETTVATHLSALGGEIQHTLKSETRGYTLTLSVDSSSYSVSKFYTTIDVERATVDTLRLQLIHLYHSLAQKIIDRNVGEGVIYVR